MLLYSGNQTNYSFLFLLNNIFFSIPIATDILFRRKRYFDFIKWSIISGVTILVN